MGAATRAINDLVSIDTSNKRTKGARALAVRDSNVSRWCLRASKGLGRKRKRLLRTTIYSSFTLSLLWIIIWTRPQTTSQVQVKLIHSLSIFLALMQWMRVSKKVDTLRRNRKKVEEGRQKGVKGSH